MPDDSTLEEELERLPNQARAHLRAAEKRAKELEREAEDGRKAKQDLAALRLGIDLTTGTGKMFADAYKGEWTAEAVKEALAEYGIEPSAVGKPQSEGEGKQGDEQSEAERQREEARLAATRGQQHFGEQRFGDLKPPGFDREDRMIAEVNEAVASKPGDFVGQREAVRAVFHRNGMAFADEIE